jgi:hypothetical protein
VARGQAVSAKHPHSTTLTISRDHSNGVR